MREIDTIIVHCAATSGDVDAETIDRWHKDRGWKGIGYHVVVRQNGSVETGRGLGEVGAHARGHNANSIGICLAGGLDPTKGYTAAQWASLAGLCKGLKEQYDVQIIGHNDVTDEKTCPNFDVKHWASTI